MIPLFCAKTVNAEFDLITPLERVVGSEQGLSLPCFPGMTPEQVDTVISAVKAFFS